MDLGARRRKKVLALVLAMAMSLSLAVTAGAAFNDQDKIVNTEAVDMCVALNIINGRTDGSFDPAGNVTRAEAAKMITIALNGGKEPVLSASATPSYTDIAGHWAAKYIEYCTSLGIVAGDGAGKFNPNGNVKAVELAKMLLIAIGYNAENEKFVGKNWDTNVNVVASQKDLYEELESIDPSVAATRDTAAQMVWNALKAVMVEYDYKLTTDANGNITSELKVKDTNPKETLLTDKYNSQPVTGIITKVEFDAEDAEYSYTVQGVNAKIVTEADYSDLFGHKVTFLTKGGALDKVYGAYDNGSEIVAAPAHAYVAADKEIDGVEYDFDNAQICYHAYNDYDNAKAVPAEWDMVSFVDTDGDDEIDCGIFVPTTIDTVQYVGVKSFSLTATLKNVYFDNEENDVDTTVYEGIAEEDVVAVVAAANTIDNTNVVTKLDVVSGKVAAIKGDEAKVGETWYEVADAYADAEEPVVALGAELDYAVVNGTIVWAEATETTIAANDYVVVTAADAQGGFNKYDRAEVLYTDGTTEILDIKLAEGQTVTGETSIVGGIFVLDEDETDDGVYVLNPVVTTTDSGFDGGKIASVTVADDKLDSKAIAADAIVFVNDNGDFSVTTGAKLADSTATVSHYWYNTSDSTGFDTVVLAYATADLSSTSDLMFGYVTADTLEVENADGDAVYEVTFWDGAEKNLQTTKTENVKLTVGQAFSYKLVDGAMDIQAVFTDYVRTVKAWDGENIEFYDSKTAYTVDADTVIIYVDTDKDTGVEGGKIALATKSDGENYDANVLVRNDVKDADNALEVIFVDVNNLWK